MSANPEHTRTWVRDVVRSGLLDDAARQALVEGVIATDHPRLPARETAEAWIDEAVREWYVEAATWPRLTEHDRLAAAFAELEHAGIPVLEGVADHWDATHALRERPVRGILWFLPTDVWHAVDQPMFEVNVWHGDGANAAPGDALLDDVVAAFAAQGLEAHFDEGRVEVAARWQRRPGR